MTDTEMVALAEQIATAAHDCQVREFGHDKGQPYIVHPQRVAACVRGYGASAEAVAWLHDVIEDTHIKERDLHDAGFPFAVIEAVVTLTKLHREPYLDFILRIRANWLATQVKCADINDNLQGLERGSLMDKYSMGLWILRNTHVHQQHDRGC